MKLLSKMIFAAIFCGLMLVSACGGGGGKGKPPNFNGTWVSEEVLGVAGVFTFSGKTFKSTFGDLVMEGTFEIEEVIKEKDIKTGYLTIFYKFDGNDQKSKMVYALEGKELTLNNLKHTKK